MDICVRCGACADKCHYFIGSGDPKNMPVLRAELLRSVYRKDFTMAGKILGKLNGARVLEEDVLKEWFLYFYQCTECRRCSLFCPYGIDTAEITMMARELMHEVGLGINWIMEPVANCNPHRQTTSASSPTPSRTSWSSSATTSRNTRACASTRPSTKKGMRSFS